MAEVIITASKDLHTDAFREEEEDEEEQPREWVGDVPDLAALAVSKDAQQHRKRLFTSKHAAEAKAELEMRTKHESLLALARLLPPEQLRARERAKTQQRGREKAEEIAQQMREERERKERQRAKRQAEEAKAARYAQMMREGSLRPPFLEWRAFVRRVLRLRRLMQQLMGVREQRMAGTVLFAWAVLLARAKARRRAVRKAIVRARGRSA